MTSTTTDRLAGVTASLGVKAPVVVATTANITLSGLQTIDGVSVAADNRVLVKDQTDTTQNGIYDAKSGAWVRSLDFDGARDVVTGTVIYVTSGTTNSGTFWKVSTSGDPLPGSAMAFSSSVNSLSGVSAFIETLLDDANATAALATLGAASIASVAAKQDQDDLLDDIAAITATAGDILYVNNSADIVNLAKGSNGQVLTLATGLPSWATPSTSQGLVPILAITASNDSSVEFVHGQAGAVFDSTYKAYMVVMSDIVSATDAVKFYLRVTENGGVSPTWENGASDYKYSIVEIGDTGTVTGTATASNTQIQLNRSDLGSDAGESWSGILNVFAPSSQNFTHFTTELSYDVADGTHHTARGGARYNTAADILGLQFLMSSGNIESGTFTLYGIKDA